MIPSPCLEEAFQIVRDHNVGAELDAGFDCGEFSGPAHDDMIERELAELAARYGIDPDDLRYAVTCHNMTQDEAAAISDSQVQS